jgi:hypothetical protein
MGYPRKVPIMLTRQTCAALAIGLSATAVAGCSGDNSKTSAPQTSTSSSVTAVQLPQGDEPAHLDPADFTTEIDNPYWPMKPGTRWTFRETDGEGGEAKVVVIVTNLTKKLANGVTARVVRDTVTEDGQVVEDTNDWYAQDAKGNIWYLGEDTAEYEDGKVSSRAGSFEAGVDGALPGIAVPADPQPGMEYRQEFYKGEAEDSGRVLSTDEMAEVPAGHYRDALLTKDFTPLEPDVLEYKLYATGVGPVLTLTASGGAGREELLTTDQVTGSEGTGPLGNPNP